MAWFIPISVLLIETGVGGHKGEIYRFMRAKGYKRLADFRSPTTLNDVFYHPNETRPSHAPRYIDVKRAAQRGHTQDGGRGVARLVTAVSIGLACAVVCVACLCVLEARLD